MNEYRGLGPDAGDRSVHLFNQCCATQVDRPIVDDRRSRLQGPCERIREGDPCASFDDHGAIGQGHILRHGHGYGNRGDQRQE